MKNKIILEIRVGEGGDDAKLLVEDMTNIYLKSAKNNNFSYEIVEKRSGICVI
jgi:protein subunit release factor A